jgi:hypothetical protein
MSFQFVGSPRQPVVYAAPPFKTKPPTETPFPTNTPTITPVPPTATTTPIFSPSPTPGVFPSPTPTPITTASPYTIPFGRSSVRIDGNCSSFEYFDALKVNFVDGNNTTGIVYLKHDQQNLFICMVGAQGSYASRFAAVYLDPDGRGEPFPSADELSLRIGITDGSMTTLRGGGSPGLYSFTTLQGWTAAVQTGSSTFSSITPYDMAEYKIPLAYTTQCGTNAYLAVYHTWFDGPSNDYGWPQSQYWDQPSTWADVQIFGINNLVSCTFLPMVKK